MSDSPDKLRDSEARLRTILDIASDGIVSVDDTGTIRTFNRAAEKIFGYTSDDVIGEKLSVLAPQPSGAGFLTVLTRYLATGEKHFIGRRREIEGIRKDGTTFPMEVSVTEGSLNGRPIFTSLIRDLTEKKRMEEALGESEQRLRMVLTSLPVVLFAVDAEGIFTISEGKGLEGIGLKPGEAVGTSVFDLYRDYPKITDSIRRSLNGESDSFSVDLEGKLYEAHNVPLRDSENRVIGASGVAVDVTDRVRAQEELSILSQALDESLNEVCIFDAETLRFTYVNRGALQNMGYDESEMYEMTPLTLTDPVLKETEFRRFVEPLVSGKKSSLTFRTVNRRKDGSTYSSENRLSFHRLGDHDYFLAVLVDITERLHADEILRASEARYRSVFDSIRDALLIFEEDGHIFDANPAACVMHGYSVEELKKLHGKQIIARKFHDQFDDFLDGGWKDAPPIEGMHICKNGDELDVEVLGAQFTTPSGDSPRLFAVVRDISERKRAEKERLALERQIQQAQKLESLGILAGGIAHDFNNLLVSVLGNAELALSDLSPESSARSNLEEIETAAQRAADLCSQMLAYSGKGRFVVEIFDLNEVVREMAHLLKVSISKKASLKFNLAPNLAPIEADATQIRQVIMNLITNASESLGDDGGTISMKTGVLDCDGAYLAETYAGEELGEGRYVFLEVADTGCGMTEKEQKRIFDPFFTTKFAGRGLGLAAVLGIVRGHRGGINVSSVRGQGTTITVLFPARSERPISMQPPPDADDKWRGKGTVLVVDDEEGVRNVCQRLLERMGFDVLTAKDGLEAVEVFRGRGDDIRCVILDLTMPRMDGEKAYGELRRLREDIPIIISSGFNEEELSDRFGEEGSVAFIQKPYRATDLRDMLRRVLEN